MLNITAKRTAQRQFSLFAYYFSSKYLLIVLSTACSIKNMIAVSIGSMTALEITLPGRIARKAFPYSILSQRVLSRMLTIFSMAYFSGLC